MYPYQVKITDIYDFRKHTYPPNDAPSYIPRLSNELSSNKRDILSRHCHLMIYIWLENEKEMWFFPTWFEKNTMFGYEWNDGKWKNKRVEISDVVAFFLRGKKGSCV